MKIESWLNQAEERITDGSGITAEDLRALRTLLEGEQQHLLYLWMREDRVDSDVVGWNYFGPFKSEFNFDPKNECPYKSVRDAMADGWRTISFPSVEYPIDNAHNQLGHEYILERYFPAGEGLDVTPHGQRVLD